MIYVRLCKTTVWVTLEVIIYVRLCKTTEWVTLEGIIYIYKTIVLGNTGGHGIGKSM